MRKLSSSLPQFPDILFVHQGNVKEGEAFFQRFWPEARAVSDNSKTLFTAFGLVRGGVKELFGPKAFLSGIRATLNGSYGGKPTGDVRLMPGAFLVQSEQIVWEHNYRHIGDHPNFAQLPALIEKRRSGV